MAAVALLDALRAVTSFTPPAVLPDCDLGLFADVLEAHGLAPLAAYQLVLGARADRRPPFGIHIRPAELPPFSGASR